MKISCIDIGGTYIKSGVLEDGVLTDGEETLYLTVKYENGYAMSESKYISPQEFN